MTIQLTEKDRELLRIAAGWCDGTLDVSDPGPLAHAAAVIRRIADAPRAPVGVEDIIEAFDEITGLCRHLRQGGPAPEDLHDLSGALDEAIGIAGNMLAALTQQPAAAGEEIMVNAAHDVYTLPLQPSGLLSGPRFVVHVPGPDQQPAVSAPVGIVLTAEEREWLEYAVGLMLDGTEPEDATCGKVLRALLDRASAPTPAAAPSSSDPRAQYDASGKLVAYDARGGFMTPAYDRDFLARVCDDYADIPAEWRAFQAAPVIEQARLLREADDAENARTVNRSAASEESRSDDEAPRIACPRCHHGNPPGLKRCAWCKLDFDLDARARAYAERMGDRWEHMGEEARDAARRRVLEQGEG